MDIFIEQIVSRQPNLQDTLKKVGIVILAILLTVVLFFVAQIFPSFSMIILMLAAGAIYGAFYLISGFNVEYEYIVTNGEIDIDKIIAKRKRKRLITVRVATFEKFGMLKEVPGANPGTTIIASAGIPDQDYYAEFNHTKHGHVRLIFSPDDKVLTAIKPFIPRTIH